MALLNSLDYGLALILEISQKALAVLEETKFKDGWFLSKEKLL